MNLSNSRLSLLGLIALLTPVYAQEQPAPVQAQFRNVPVAVPTYQTGIYAPNYNPYGGALTGAANVIDAQGNMMVNQQQAYIMREQAKSSRIDNKRKKLDEQLYERKVTPTNEDERERARIENLRRSRNNPPLTEIWTGKPLNDLLLAIQQQTAQGVTGPNIPLNQELLPHINVTGGQSQGSLGMLRDGGKLNWPLELQGGTYDFDRGELDKLGPKVVKEAEAGSISGKTILAMRNSVVSMQSALLGRVHDAPFNDYIKAKRFLSDLDDTIKVLQEPSAGNYVSKKWAARGVNVFQLTMNMTNEGLKFAPYTPGDENAYIALHTAMVQYYVPSDKPWDPFAK